MNIIRKLMIMVSLMIVVLGVSTPAFARDGWYRHDNSYRVYHNDFYVQRIYYRRTYVRHYNRHNYHNYEDNDGGNLVAGIILGVVVGTLLNRPSPTRVYVEQPRLRCRQRRIWDRYLQQKITKTVCYSH